jgi:hypothetical protein
VHFVYTCHNEGCRLEKTGTVQLPVSLVVAYATLMQGQAKRGRDDDMTTRNTKSRLNRKTVTFHNVAINLFNPMAFLPTTIGITKALPTRVIPHRKTSVQF